MRWHLYLIPFDQVDVNVVKVDTTAFFAAGTYSWGDHATKFGLGYRDTPFGTSSVRGGGATARSTTHA